MIPTITLWKSSSPFSLKGNALGECWLVSSRCVAAFQMVFDMLPDMVFDVVLDMVLDMVFGMVFDTVFDMTVWFGGRDGCVRTEARVEVRRRRERASGWKRREVRRVRREKAVMAVITSAMEVKALTTHASLGRLWVRRRRRSNSEEKHCWKRRGEDHTVCASGGEMTLEVRERGREDERKEARSELICCSCCSSSCRHRTTCTRNNGGRWGATIRLEENAARAVAQRIDENEREKGARHGLEARGEESAVAGGECLDVLGNLVLQCAATGDE